MEFLVWFSFEANSPAEIGSETERIIQTCGRDVEVFSFCDENDNVVLTEEDLGKGGILIGADFLVAV